MRSLKYLFPALLLVCLLMFAATPAMANTGSRSPATRHTTSFDGMRLTAAVRSLSTYRLASLPPDAYEPDDTTTTAQVVTDAGLPFSQAHSIDSTNPASLDYDVFKITGTAGTLYTYQTSGAADTWFDVYDADTLELLAWYDDSEAGTGAMGTWRCPTNGKSIYVVVSPANPVTGGGDYTMRVDGQPNTDLPDGYAERMYGANRYAAAVAYAKDIHTSWNKPLGGKVTDVIVASGDSKAQVGPMISQSLAGVLGAPILLCSRYSLPAETKSAISAIRTHNGGKVRIHVIGNSGWVSSSVYTKLKALKGSSGTIERISGADRFYLAAIIADRVDALWIGHRGHHSPTVIVANGTNVNAITDLLVASGISYKCGWPILLTNTTSAPAATTWRTATRFKGSRVLFANCATYASAYVYRKLSGDVRTTAHSDRTASALDTMRFGLAQGLFWPGDVVVINRVSEALTVGTEAGGWGSGILISTSTGPNAVGKRYFLHRPGMVVYVLVAGSATGITSGGVSAYQGLLR